MHLNYWHKWKEIQQIIVNLKGHNFCKGQPLSSLAQGAKKIIFFNGDGKPEQRNLEFCWTLRISCNFVLQLSLLFLWTQKFWLWFGTLNSHYSWHMLLSSIFMHCKIEGTPLYWCGRLNHMEFLENARPCVMSERWTVYVAKNKAACSETEYFYASLPVTSSRCLLTYQYFKLWVMYYVQSSLQGLSEADLFSVCIHTLISTNFMHYNSIYIQGLKTSPKDSAC
jgi:hypothetical protein